MKDNPLLFATSNVGKFKEARLLLSDYGIEVKMLDAKITEIQSDDIGEIARAAVLDAVKHSKNAVFVEDAGLFIEALNNFPGPYSEFVLRTIGNKGILKLMEGIKNREAEFRSVIAYCDLDMKPTLFYGVAKGFIADCERGTSGFGYDPIFIHSKYRRRTFGEMRTDEKNKLSHRAQALRKFARWYLKRNSTQSKH